LLVFGLTSDLGNLKRDLDQDGKRSQDVLTGVVEGKLFPILTLVEGIEFGRPFDPNLVLLGNVNPYVVGLILVSFGVVAPNILRAELNAGLNGGRPDERDQRLDIDDSSKVQKPISFEMSKVVFGSGLKLDVAKISAAVSKLLGGLTRVMENQNLSGRIAKHDWDSSWIAFVGLDLVKQRAVGVEA
jgi:hypothetical protein